MNDSNKIEVLVEHFDSQVQMLAEGIQELTKDVKVIKQDVAEIKTEQKHQRVVNQVVKEHSVQIKGLEQRIELVEN